MSTSPVVVVCLQCGVPAAREAALYCRRCGLRYGDPPRESMAPTCPTCYRTASPDGLFDSLDGAGRVDLWRHMAEHDQHPVGDDDHLESLRDGADVTIGRWKAPYELVRRYLVLGVMDAGRTREALHNALLVAMGQIVRWGPNVEVEGDQPEWIEARAALVALMERYHRQRPVRV